MEVKQWKNGHIPPSRRTAYFVRLAVSGVFLYFLATKISWGYLGEIVLRVEPILFTFSCLTILVNPWFLAKKFHALLSSFERLPRLWPLLRINLICLFYAILIPTGVGVGILRWHQMGQLGLDKVGSSAVIVMERLIYLIITVLFVFLSLILSGDTAMPIIGPALVPACLVSLAVLGASLAFLAQPGLNGLAVAALDRIGGGSSGRKGKALEVAKAFASRFSGRWSTLAAATAWGIAWQVVYCVRVFAIFLALRIPMEPLTVIWIASVVLFLQILPVSYLGLGVRESAYAFIFVQYGLPGEQGVSVGLLSFLQMVLAALVGWFLAMKDSRKGKGTER